MTMLRFVPLALACCLVAQAGHAAKIKKWVDEDGVTQYGTSIPPQYIDQEHTELNRHGIAVDHQDRARTAEEVARANEVKRLRAEQARLLQEQKASDRMLLNLYRSEDDLIMIRDGKITQLDTQIRFKRKEIERLKQRLSKLQSRAAEFERAGRKLDKNTMDDLHGTQRQIEKTYSSILGQQEQKTAIADRYNADLGRFRQLKQINSERSNRAAAKKDVKVVIDTAVTCPTSGDCSTLWEKAKAYATRNATTRVEVVGPRILVTAAARDIHDISITVSRIANEKVGTERVFMDLQCGKSLAAKDFCKTPEVNAIRRNFALEVNP